MEPLERAAVVNWPKGRYRKLLSNTALVVLSLLLAFGICELTVRLLYKDGTVLFPRYHTDYRYGPYVLRGSRANAAFWHTSVDGTWKFVTNSKGLRDSREFEYAKPAGTIRVLALGDSHTQGHEVRQEATYSAVLERYLDAHGSPTEVLNAGVSGFSTAEELAFLENEGYKYHPDFVVVGFYANDFEDNAKADLFDIQQGQLVEIGHEHIPGVRIQNIIYGIPGVHWLSENSYFYSLLYNNVWTYFKLRLAQRSRSQRTRAQGTTGNGDDAFEYAVPTTNTNTQHQIELAARLIERMHDFCATRGIALLVLDIPAAESGSQHFRSSMPPTFVARLDAMHVERIASAPVFEEFAGAVEIHVPHGYHHISEFAHALLGVELGRRMLGHLRAVPRQDGND